jgi:hypothetical protein
VAVELADHPVQRPQRGVGGQPDPEHRDALVALAGHRTAAADLGAVEAAGEAAGGGGLAQARQRVDDSCPADPVGILPPGRDDQVQLLVDGGQLRGAQDAEVGVPVMPGLVVVLPRRLAQPFQLTGLQLLRALPRGRLHVAAPAFLARQAVERAGHSMISNASA